MLLMSTILPLCGFLVNRFCIQFLDIKQQTRTRNRALLAGCQSGNGAVAWLRGRRRERRRERWTWLAMPASGAGGETIVDNVAAPCLCRKGKVRLDARRLDEAANLAERTPGRVRPGFTGIAEYCGLDGGPAAARNGGPGRVSEPGAPAGAKNGSARCRSIENARSPTRRASPAPGRRRPGRAARRKRRRGPPSRYS